METATSDSGFLINAAKMKEIKLTRGMVALVDDSDFEYLNQFTWYADKGGNTFYANRNEYHTENGIGKQRKIKMHRQILGLTDPKVFGEHEDGNGLNNQRYNIRPATRSQNQMNRGSFKNSISKYVGVCPKKLFYKNKTYTYWLAQVYKNGIRVYRKTFKTEIEAAIAYNKAAVEHHKDFAKINAIPE